MPFKSHSMHLGFLCIDASLCVLYSLCVFKWGKSTELKSSHSSYVLIVQQRRTALAMVIGAKFMLNCGKESPLSEFIFVSSPNRMCNETQTHPVPSRPRQMFFAPSGPACHCAFHHWLGPVVRAVRKVCSFKHTPSRNKAGLFELSEWWLSAQARHPERPS